MLRTYKATFENGRLIYTDIPKSIKRAKVLVTIIHEEEDEEVWLPLSRNELLPFNNSLKLTVDPLAFQKEIRDEW